MTRLRAPLDASSGRPTTNHELQLARAIVDRSGVVAALEAHFVAETGRHRILPLRALLVACQLNALARHHQGHLIEVARIINALSDDQREQLGIDKHDPAQTYDRVDRSFNKLAAVLDAGHPGIDAKWFANALTQAAIPDELRQSRSIAVDGTDVETWGALHGDAVTVDLDGGIHHTFQPVTHQRGTRPFTGDALLLDGQLYSTLLPDELRDLPMPPRGAAEEVKLAHETAFNRRARWRMVRHAGPDSDGATRWRCPFCSGLLRARQFPKTMRGKKTVPLVPVDDGCEACCKGTLTAMPADVPWWQRIPFGTTAWRLSMGRRQVVESVNAALKGAFADLSRGFFRVFGQTKMTILLGFTTAGFNLDRIRSYRAKKRAQEDAKPAQPKRRRGTWRDIVDPDTGEIHTTESPPG